MRSKVLTTRSFASACGVSTGKVIGWVAAKRLHPIHAEGARKYFAIADIVPCRELAHASMTPETAELWEAALPSDLEVEAMVEELEGDGAPEPTPEPTPEDLVTEIAVLAAADEVMRIRRPASITPDTGRALKFGPITLPQVNTLTREAQQLMPSADPHYEFDAGEAVVLANALSNDLPTWAWGPTGSGKTSGAKQMCALLRWPMLRCNMHADFSVDDFVGTTEVTIDKETGNAVTAWVDGVLIQAMLTGAVLLIDEITLTPSHVLMALQGVLERAPGQPVTFPNTRNNETIVAHPRFRIIVTDNTNGQGDMTGAHIGTNVINEATRNRFIQWLHKVYPAPKAWKSMLINKTGISSTVADQILKVAAAVNKGSAMLSAKAVTSNLIVSPRDTLAVARLAVSFGNLKAAFSVGMVNAIDPTSPDHQFLKDTVRNVVGA